MPQKTVTIVNKLGLHARASAKLVNTAKRFGCEITLSKDHKTVSAKGIMDVMMLAATKGTELVVETRDGDDAQEALDSMVDLIEQRFGETE
jgi:phosphocarrier protein HPr